MNWTDSEKIAAILVDLGMNMVASLEDADVLIVNTCSVRQRAEDKVYGLARRVAIRKKHHPRFRVVMTGCMAQRIQRSGCSERIDRKYISNLRRKMPWVDEILPIGEYSKLSDIVGRTLPLRTGYSSYVTGTQMNNSSFQAYVPITSGCNNFCSYCIVPYTRGSEVHRDSAEIITQVVDLIDKGYCLITFLGQNVNSWIGEVDGRPARFHDLLRCILELPGDYWITYLTSHPKDYTDELAKVHLHPKMCQYISLPVQSGSTTVLNAMNRGYTREMYLDTVKMIRDICPSIRLSTDIIVGFPGEREEDFAQSLSLIETVGYGMVYIAEYSPRPPAASVSLKETVSKEEKSRRRVLLEEAQRRSMRRNNESYVGRTIRVLVTGPSSGITHDLREIQFNDICKVGSFTDVLVTDSSASGLVGSISV